MKIALISMEIIPGRPDLNMEHIRKKIEEAKAAGAETAVFPAFALSGKFLGSAFSQPAFLRDCMDYAQEIAHAAEGVTVLFGSIADEAERPVSDGRTLLRARDGVLTEIARRPLHTSSPFSPLTYALSDENVLIAVDAAPFPTPVHGAGLAALARKHRKAVVYVNALGVQDTGKTVYAFDGVCRVYRADGAPVLTSAPYEEGLTVVDTTQLTSLAPAVEETSIAPVYRTLRYAVRKFLERIHMERVVVGISGGIDSAVSAALYVDAIGADRVLLVNMPSRFNSETTKGLAARLAENLGCRSMIVPIEESVAYTAAQLSEIPIEGAPATLGEHLTISSFVRENMQARNRSGRVLSSIAAAWGAGFTCNGNKAECTVGYATLYGDLAGFLAALADLWKYQVYDLARYLNAEVYGREAIPQGIIDIVPSAELSDAQNVDEGKGDPIRYPYHDYLFRAFAEENRLPEDILRAYAKNTLEEYIGCAAGLVAAYFPTATDFIADLEHWWGLYTGMAVAKRIQSPPILSVSSHAYGADHPESQIGAYETRAYRKLKAELMRG